VITGAALLWLAAQVATPTTVPLQTYRGTFRFGSRHTTFEGCWLSLGPGAWADFERRHPEFDDIRPNGALVAYRIAFQGVRETGDRYGHLGRYNCRYLAISVLESRRVRLRASVRR
jgi:hypothetical protein